MTDIPRLLFNHIYSLARTINRDKHEHIILDFLPIVWYNIIVVLVAKFIQILSGKFGVTLPGYGGDILKKLLIALAFLVAFLTCLTACDKAGADKSTNVEPEDQRMVQGYHPEVDLAQATMQHKLLAYENFEKKGGKMDAFISETDYGTSFHLIDFARTLGLNVEFFVRKDADNEIVITPNATYYPDDDFKYILYYSEDMVRGHDMYIGRLVNNEWAYTEHYDSATDCIIFMQGTKFVYRIGIDELNQLYRNLRVLTAPIDKIGEINESIDQELAYTE